ncbi:MAG: MFS transporter [Candidatus Syntrophonatronum acetioxidans]|uniref:MFS transporter n=1 Tax=Candidatus Syntrophonatronum acetioxidans TaxID=1795816 RepID=A0A424YBQ6_9FIRM|nr:MAG: MFS transporter [Candidatus Syntrophonatronum acetioxidans]
MTAAAQDNRGWIVTFSGTLVNTFIGILYSWSVFARFLQENFGFTSTESQIPYMIACGVFAIMMIPGGRAQDRLGPTKVITAGGLCTGIGFIGSSFITTLTGLSIFFGIVFGTAMGLVYTSATPAAVKWFGPEKRGLISGLVVAGFGGASIYTAPLAEWLILSFGVEQAFLILGIAFAIVTVLVAQLIKNPPEGYVPPTTAAPPPEVKKKEEEMKEARKVRADYEWHEMVKTPQFFGLWFMFCFASLAGLLIIGHLAVISVEQAGSALGFLLVAILGLFNAGGRVVAGIVSDKIGRINTMLLVFGIQMINFLCFQFYVTEPLLLLGTAVCGAAYGANLTVFPATTADLFGTKNLGLNYGLVFSSWGVGGVFGGLIGGLVRDATGTYLTAYLIAAGLLLVCIILTFFTRKPPAAVYEEEGVGA